MKALWLLLLLVPTAHAAELDFELHDGLRLGASTVLSGQLDMGPGPLANPVASDVTALNFTQGTLTVCPLVAPQGTVVTALAALSPDCAGGQQFQNARLHYAGRVAIQMAGNITLPQPIVARTIVSGEHPHAVAALVTHALNLTADEIWRFVPVDRQAHIRIQHTDGTAWYNGSNDAFLHDGDVATLRSTGIAGTWRGDINISLGPALPEAFREVPDTTAFLDLAPLLGAEREPRRNATHLLGEFGRAPEMTNGAVFGFLNGTAHGLRLAGSEPALTKGSSFQLTIEGPHLSGTYAPAVTLAGTSISLAGNAARESPYWLGITFWVLAAIVMAVRRRTSPIDATQRATFTASALVGWIILDGAMKHHIGVASGPLLLTPGRLGQGLALLTFEAVTLGLACALLLWPVLLATRRIAPAAHHRWTDAAVLALWLVSLLVFQGHYFSLGLDFARL